MCQSEPKWPIICVCWSSEVYSPLLNVLSSRAEAEQEEAEEEEELSEIEVEQAPPVVPIPAPVEPPVKRKRGRPPKNKPDSKCRTPNVLLLERWIVFE